MTPMLLFWATLAGLGLVCMLPLLIVLRPGAPLRGRRDAALALHRAQLAELDRDRAEGRLPDSEHAAAVLDVQRRLLAADAMPDVVVDQPRGGRGVLIATAIIVPLAACLLYLVHGAPGLPAMPLRARIQAAQAQVRDVQALIDRLHARIAEFDPASKSAHDGYLLLGNMEARRRNMAAAAEAWGHALASGFTPELALQTAEAQTESAGRVTPQAAALFRRALDAAPADAPWRRMAEKRLGQAAP